MNSKTQIDSSRNLSFFNRIIVLIFIFLTVYPVIFVTLTSLKSTKEFYVNIWGLPKHLEWSNYYKSWVTSHIGNYFFNSLIVVGISVICILIMGALAGYALARLRLPYANIILFIIIFTQLLPLESVLMPLYIMMSKMKLLGSYLTLIIPYIGWGLPMTILIYKNFFETIPSELLEAARVDGCTEYRIFAYVTVPLMLPATATNAIFNFVGLWGELMWASVSLSTTSMGTIPMGVISFKQQFSTDWGPLSAAICVVLIPLVLIFLLTQKYFVQGLSSGAVKG